MIGSMTRRCGGRWLAAVLAGLMVWLGMGFMPLAGRGVARAAVGPGPKIYVFPYQPIRDGASKEVVTQIGDLLKNEIKHSDEVQLQKGPIFIPETTGTPVKPLSDRELKQAEKLRRAGDKHYQAFRFGKAIRSYQAALARYQKSLALLSDFTPVIEALLMLSVCYYRTDREDDGAKMLVKVIRLKPDIVLDPERYPPMFRNVAEGIRKKLLLKSRGELEVLANVEGATVFFDGRKVGTTPILMKELVPGEHFLRVEKEGLQPWADKVTVVSTQRRRVLASLGGVKKLAGPLGARYPEGHLKRYWPGDRIGRAGVERAAEDLLRGTRGVYQKAIDGKYLENVDPAPGRDVHLTLDAALQSDVEDLLDHGPAGRVVGAAVVLDCTSGEVLVLASAPRYDVRLFGVDYPDLVRRTDRPLVHRAIAGQYPLGSVFKAVTATCALEEGAITPHTFLTCDGVLDPAHPERFRCHVYLTHGYGHGTIPLRTAIQKSCNVYFYKVALALSRMGGRFDLGRGRDRLVAWARRMGLGARTGIPLPGEADGRLDVRDPRNLAVGQGELLVTPIQAAQLYGLVASGGRMPPLRLIRELPPTEAARPGLHVSPNTVRVLRDAFSAVVNEPGGTAYWRRPRRVTFRAAGKTGTAQVVKQGQDRGRDLPYDFRDHAWFVGWAPAERPRILVAVVNEHGGHGSSGAAPLVMELITYYLESLYPAVSSGGSS